MKRFKILSLFILWTLSVMAQPQMKFDREVNSMGAVLWANPVTSVFRFTNMGNEPLEIFDVKTSCACTVAEWPQKPIEPGQSGQILAVFDAKALGHFYKEVEIKSNATSEPVYLQMEGKVVASGEDIVNVEGFDIEMGDVKLDKDAIVFARVAKGEEPVEEISILNTSRAAFEPILMHAPEYLEVTAIPKRIPAGRNGKIRIKLLSDKLHDTGLTETSVYLSRYFGDKVSVDNELRVSVVFSPEANSSSSGLAPKLQLAANEIPLQLKGKPKGKTTVLLKNTGNAVLLIDRLQVLSPGTDVTLPKKEIIPGASLKMKITVDQTKLNGGRQPKVLLVTNDPEKPVEMITLKLD